MKTPELRPCPFCGGKAKLVKSKSKMTDIRIRCTKCGIKTGWWMGESVELMKGWNARVYPEEVQKAVISQTPRLVTVLKTERGGKNFFCPACDNDVHFTYSHCTCCGQRLDWGENES